MSKNIELGRTGEDLAVEHYEALGLTIISRNWRCREGELDIVATDHRDLLVICEVKTRSGVGFGLPVESITSGKRRRIRRLAALWLGEHRTRPDIHIRFDVVGVLAEPGKSVELTHIEGAF
ncbi:YraN family protein [Nakamurella antarctica]|uniref:UPF0102 protein EH165_06360 n=1 Tax=Nakamurella antarctica TaxID=1902245 RepID=A0A3G8ZKI9_9ACTN|nr:YraN family protein [Nakamurella antarctica]AZI57829.1 YraN family protein [Nakamurella antarctica]